MHYTKLGGTGLDVSRLTFGTGRATWGKRVALPAADAMLSMAYEHGINVFDTAENYGGRGEAERMLGVLIKQHAWPRYRYVISTKVFWFEDDYPNGSGLSRKKIRTSCDASLQRLGLDYIDLYYCHSFDDATPLEETCAAMHQLVEQGKILYWGTSNWTAAQVDAAVQLCRAQGLTLPVMEQRAYNYFTRSWIDGDFPRVAEAAKLGVFTYSPLDEGILTGKYNQGIPENSRLALPSFADIRADLEGTPVGRQKIATVQTLTQHAASVGMTIAQFAIAWCLHNPLVHSVVLGATSPEQLQSNLKVLELLPKLPADFFSSH